MICGQKVDGVNMSDKSKVMIVNKSLSAAFEALQEIERFSLYCGLEHGQANMNRLLAEEMIAMTTDVLEACEGKLWIEIENGENCDIHLIARAPIDPKAKEEFISASKAKRNTRVKGLRNKISAIFADFLCGYEQAELYNVPGSVMMSGMGVNPIYTGEVWSLNAYEANTPKEQKAAELEGVEKSIIDSFADDVIVSVKDSWVEMVAKKRFEKNA